MAEHSSGGGGDSPIKFALIFFGVIFLIWFIGTRTQGGGGIFGNASSTLGTLSPFASSTTRERTSTSTRPTVFSASNEELRAPTPREIERDLYDTSRAITHLKEDIAHARKWGVLSPYKDILSLQKGSAAQEKADIEYLSLSYSKSNGEPITITGWTLESTVSGTRVTIPPGVRLPRFGDTTAQPVVLEPRETAIITTGESPLGVSFHENRCTGYLSEFQTFVPALSRSCPSPRDELKQLGTISLADDTCYDAIARTSACRLAPDTVFDLNLSHACTTFLRDNLTYAGCVRNHRADPYFYKGTWRLYLERNKELWREEREIIRLLDSEGKTVDIVEY